MCGNVYEWCQDWQDDIPILPLTNPEEAINCELYVIQGVVLIFMLNIVKLHFAFL